MNGKAHNSGGTSGFRTGSHYRIGSQHGFTLMEIVLVLAIIVAIGAIVAPLYTGTLRTERLRKSAQMIAADWNVTRSKAMETGETQVWVCQLDEGSFSSASYTGVGGMTPADAASMVATSTGLNSTDSSTSTVGQSAMAEGVSISDLMVSEADTVMLMSQSASPTGGESGGAATIFFYPDGTSSSARLTVVNEEEQARTIVMNGFAGTVRIISGGDTSQ